MYGDDLIKGGCALKELIEVYGDNKYIINIFPETEESIIKEQLGVDIRKEKEVRKYFGPNVRVNAFHRNVWYNFEKPIENYMK